MKDLDARLVAHFARIQPSADFDARLAARLAAEQESDARRDRAAALRAALERHARERAVAAGERRRSLLGLVGLALLALALVVATLPAWRSFGLLLAGGTASATAAPAGLAVAVLVAAVALALTARPRWLGTLRVELLP